MIYALHGFLGLPSDWKSFSNVVAWDVLQAGYPSESIGLWEWASRFNEIAKKGTRRILMGYSLGGRLAMHALLHSPHLWDGAILISAHPGLANDDEKLKRLNNDKAWSERFATRPWESLMQQWNSQSVFSGKSFERKEEDFSRQTLADMLRHWSLGRQDDLSLSLKSLSMPILWIAGQRDSTYASLAQSMASSNPFSQVWLAPEAGHRVPWENQRLFQQQIQEFMRNHVRNMATS